MKYTLRALLAVAVLAGFYVCALAIVVALGYGAYLATSAGQAVVAVKAWLLCAVVAIALAVGVWSRRDSPQEPGGLLLEEKEHPDLWREVRELAEFAGTRAPDEIVLGPGVNAGVREETKFLGLVGGPRRLAVGAAMLTGLSRQQMRAVLAHELAHYSHRHTALAVIVYRGTEAIGRVLDKFVGSFVYVPLELYGRLYIRIARSVNRRQELEADRLMAELVGPTTAIDALEQTNALQAALDSFFHDYVAPGTELGCRPHDLFDGYRRFVADPERQRQLAEMRAAMTDPPPSVYDSHPPTSRRVAAIKAFGLRDDPADRSSSAVDLLGDSQSTLAEVGERPFDGSGLRAAGFEEIATLAATSRTAHNATVFLNALSMRAIANPTLGDAVAVLKEGRPEALLDLVPHSDEDPDAAYRTVAMLLGDTIAHCLIEGDVASYQLDWAGPSRLVDSTDAPLDPWTLAAEALAGGDTAVAALDQWLDRRHVLRDREVPPLQYEPPPSEPTCWLGLVAPVRKKIWSNDGVLGVVDSGLLVCRTRYAERLAARSGFSDGGAKFVERYLGYQPADLVAESRARHVPWDSIRSITVSRNWLHQSTMTITESDGSTLRLTWSASASIAGDFSAVDLHLGDRLTMAASSTFQDLARR